MHNKETWYYKEMKNIVVAYDKNHGIGAENDLLWLRDLPADLRHFKELTLGHPVIMGRNTFQSIGRALPGRQNIVVSRHPLEAEGVTFASSLEDAYQIADEDVIFIIGGGEIYKQALEGTDRIYATEVDAVFENATVFFPVFDMSVWRETAREHHGADERNKYAYDFVTYERR